MNIQKVCVIGGGLMGRQIALNTAIYPYQVTVFDSNPAVQEDIAKWEDTIDYCAYFFKKPESYEWAENIGKEDVIEILETYKTVYDKNETAEEWFPKVRDMAESLGYAKAPKMYKKDPDAFKGHVGDVATAIRIAVTGRRNSPDLYEIMQVLGYDEFLSRIDLAIENVR